MLYDVEMARAQIQEKSCDVRSATIHFLERTSETSSTLLFLHSFASGAFLWREFIESINFDGRIIALDLPGNGRSSLPSQAPTIEYYVQFLKDFCEATIVERFIGVGVSMGSNILAAFALKYPQQIQRLMLTNPIDDTAPLNRLWKIVAQPGIGEMITRLFPGSMSALRKQIGKNFYNQSKLKAELISVWWESFENREVRRWIPKALRAEPTTIQWQNIRVPCTVVFGKNDPVVSEKFRSRLRTTLTSAEFVELDQCGHYPHIECPEKIEPLIHE